MHWREFNEEECEAFVTAYRIERPEATEAEAREAATQWEIAVEADQSWVRRIVR